VRKKAYVQSGYRLLEHLDKKLDPGVGYPDEPTWGYAFTLLASLEMNSKFENNNLAQKSLDHYRKQDKSGGYSWEFTTYALKRSAALSKTEEIISECEYKEKGTRMINWTLLRQLNKVYYKKNNILSILLIKVIKYIFTLSDGQILDELKTRSLQYHSFCLFLLAELDETEMHSWVKDWLIKGCLFSVRSIMNDGTALYMGRGQEQIFGYGALLYALEYTSKKYNLDFDTEIEAVWNRLSSFQRSDGSYPLVLNESFPEKADISYAKNKPHGWYGYNTLYDYQPFLAYCLLKTAKL
jgi:hypothetical protein